MRVRLRRAQLASRPGVLVALVLLVSSPLTGLAQAGASAQVGATVRAKPRGAGARWVQGELVALTSDSVMIRARKGRKTVALATSTLAQFDVSQGRYARTGKGALLGLGIGAGAGLLFGLAAAAEHCTDFCEINVGPEDVFALTALGGGLGAGIGALIGAASHDERWQRVGETHPAVHLGPKAKGVGVGLRVGF